MDFELYNKNTILAYYTRGSGFDSRIVETFVYMNMSVCIESECFYV
jgi:hypothetical protein